MLKTLPYNALRTLEAVVRLRGFGRAAEELNVTQSAVSQHVKLLEDWLGQQLLIRRGRVTTPTEAGIRLADATRDGFGGVERICDELRGGQAGQDAGILVASPPGFAFLWLLPRLLRFDEQHPDIPVSLSTDPLSRDPAAGDADVIIAYSAGGFPGLHAERLMRDEMAPVCTPAIAERLRDVSDLSSLIVLQDTLEDADASTTWDFWAREVGKPLPRFARTRRFGQANLVIQAAIDGLGIAMGRGPLVADALREGRLVRPFPDVAVSQYSYWLVCRHDALALPGVQAFGRWIHAEASGPSGAATVAQR